MMNRRLTVGRIMILLQLTLSSVDALLPLPMTTPMQMPVLTQRPTAPECGTCAQTQKQHMLTTTISPFSAMSSWMLLSLVTQVPWQTTSSPLPLDDQYAKSMTVHQPQQQQQQQHQLLVQTTPDIVVRVLDANTVKLETIGMVSLAAIQTPSGYSGEFPECMAYTPASKIKQLLPPNSPVTIVKLVDVAIGSSGKTKIIPTSASPPAGPTVQPRRRPPAVLMWTKNGKLLNVELVRTGMAKPSRRGLEQAEAVLPGLGQALEHSQAEARASHSGMYQTCETQNAQLQEFNNDLQFEPLQFTVETQYFADGGTQVRKESSLTKSPPYTPPPNPGDTRGCSNFQTYEEALKWFEYYQPFYGDVAKLDTDHDGIPCPGLPHTKDNERYRMKIPSTASK